VVEVSGFEDLKAADVLFGFRVRAVGGGDFAVFPRQGHCGLWRMKRDFGDEMSGGAEVVVVREAIVEDCVALVVGHAFEFSWFEVSQAEVFHCSCPWCFRFG